MELQITDTGHPTDSDDLASAPELAEDNDYRMVMLLAAGLARIRRNRARIEAGKQLRRASAEDGLLPAAWRSGMVRLWWRFHRAGVPPPASDLELIELCRRPFGQWPLRLRLSEADQAMSILDGDELSLMGEQAVALRMADVEAELVEREIYAELVTTAQMNGADAESVQFAYAFLRRFLIDHPVISDRDALVLVRRFPAYGGSGQPYVRRFLNAAYDSRPAQDTVPLQTCGGCGNLLDGADEACGTAGCSGRPVARSLRVTACYHVQHRAARRFFHDPGLVEARLIDSIREHTPRGGVHVEEWPELDSYDLRISFPEAHASGRPGEVWGADAKDHVSPGLLGIGFRWKPEPPCDRRFLVLPMHRARQRGYIEDLDAELDGRGSGVTVIDEETFIIRVVERARQAADR